jgi:formamidopyrimidine-DNA glycosylase
MPELPDISAYVECLRQRLIRATLTRVRLRSPFVLRSVEPPIEALEGKTVAGVQRLGKRVVLAFDDELYLLVHLMIAGRFQWKQGGADRLSKICLAAFDFSSGTLLLTEAAQKKRAALYVLRGAASLAVHNPGGLDVLSADAPAFAAALRRENRTLKRALTDPRLFDGIGNAYSDEILHAARMAPTQVTSRLTDRDAAQLLAAAQSVLARWIDELRRRFATRFPGPGDITAFREEFAVHGRYGKPCPVCGDTVQRIRYAENETNYCPTCQTGGRVLADRSLSRLLKDDWPSHARYMSDD